MVSKSKRAERLFLICSWDAEEGDVSGEHDYVRIPNYMGGGRDVTADLHQGIVLKDQTFNTYDSNGKLTSKRQKAYLRLKSIAVKELKGLRDCEITFDKPLTAIMGVNGSGKTTILHALACCFKQDDRFGRAPIFREKRRFKEFFPPNTDAQWDGTEFKLRYDIVDENGNVKYADREMVYSKPGERWSPRYDRQPIKDTVYVGISECEPDIESFKKGRLYYQTTILDDKQSDKIISLAAAILNKDYEKLTENISDKTKLIGVKTRNNLKYSSLSMGAGEQRVIRLLRVFDKAPKESLILIDEIDLLMETSALRRLIENLSRIAIKKDLQVVFTTHSLIMDELKDIVSIKYLSQSISANNQTKKTLVYNDLTTLAWNDMSGGSLRPISVFVEDELSRQIVRQIARSLGIQKKVEIEIFGAATNAFTLAAAMVIRGQSLDNVLIVIDGDVFHSKEQRDTQIKKSLSGSEADADEKRRKALSVIEMYHLPEGKSPEEHLHDLLCQSNSDSEVAREARNIRAVIDPHEWIDRIADGINDRSEAIYTFIIEECGKLEEWDEFVAPVKNWLYERRDL